MSQLLDLQALSKTPVNQQPYPHLVVEQSILAGKEAAVMQDFPALNEGGSFTLDGLDTGPQFDALIEEIRGPEFRQLMSDKLQLNLAALPMIATLRGVSRAKDGRVHTDSKSKIATILIYFNDNWTAETGKLRVLNSNNMEDMVSEIAPNAGTLFAFKVTDNCWHGYPAFEGIRRSIQINFVADDAAVQKHHNRHGWTAKVKGIRKLFGGGGGSE